MKDPMWYIQQTRAEAAQKQSAKLTELTDELDQFTEQELLALYMCAAVHGNAVPETDGYDKALDLKLFDQETGEFYDSDLINSACSAQMDKRGM